MPVKVNPAGHDAVIIVVGAAAVFLGESPKGFPSDIGNVARRKLRMLDQAKTVSDLRVPPSDRLGGLERDRHGQHRA